MLLVEADHTVDIFDVIEVTDALVRVRTPYLFEIGEELIVRIERGDRSEDVHARVRAHVGAPGDTPSTAKITELELEPRG